MRESTDHENAGVSERFDRRGVLRVIGSVPFVGGAVALSTVANANEYGAVMTDAEKSGVETTTRTVDSTGGDGHAIRSLECDEFLTAQFTEDDPRTPTGADALSGVPQGHRYHEYRFDGYADEWVYFTASVEEIPNPDYEGIGDDPFYYAGDPALFLFDGEELIGYDPEAGYWGMAHVAARLPSDGTYRLITTAAFSRDPTFEYELHANCSHRTPVTDHSLEPTPLECGETLTGAFTEDSLRHRDIDSQLYNVYSFEGRCGDCVTITSRSNEEPTRPRPVLFDPDGRYDGPIRRGDGTHIPGAEATFTSEEFVLSEYRLPKTGTYTIWIGSYGPTYYEYELSLEC